VTGPHRFAVDEDRDLADLADALCARGAFVAEPARTVVRTAFDTFDWRLWKAGTRLELEVAEAERGGRRSPPTSWLVWRNLDTGEGLGRLAVDQVPDFVWDLPSGPTRDRLAEVVEMRALRALASVRSRQVTLALVDDEGKAQARVLLDASVELIDEVAAEVPGELLGDEPPPEGAHTPGALATVVEVQPVRGYPRATEQVAALLAAQVVLAPTSDDAVDQVLRRHGRRPGDYSSKLGLHLDPHGTMAQAVVAVMARLTRTMADNLAGTRADTDSEFLHDFRVAVRRARSVMGMAAGVVAPDLLVHLRAELKWLGDITTPTRDLDVYLLEFDQFEQAVGAARRGDLASLRAFLVERQHQAQAQLVAALDSARYAALVEALERWLAQGAPSAAGAPAATADDGQHQTPDADRPAAEVAAARTWRIYRRLVRDGRRITPASPPTELHDLRKDAKKLRYALECFGSLFDPDEIALGVKELKGVQDVLGTFQDCEVQKASLASLGGELIDEQGASTAATLLAMGALVDQLDAREAQARAAFAACFARFDRPEVRRRFEHLFRPADQSGGA
jgi:CHAD domain-containing protein